MAIRTGMQNLVNRVRTLTGAGTAEYAAGTSTYWTDDHLEDILDAHNHFVVGSPVTWMPEQTGGSVVYWNGSLAYRDIEEAPGTVDNSRFILRDSIGAAIGTANYTVDYRAGRISFGTVNQAGTAYYWTGYTYDVYAAAADVWLERLAHFQDWYDFSADNQSFDRAEVFNHAEKMERLMRGKAGQNVTGDISGDVRVSQFIRTDLNPTGWK